ncbi:type II secretion system F family protein [Candidatus Woesearchaeota archaeon]|jgi:archaeal flagellar protein FlaJ|nr:type II secretion system F family protein [Candidatus Woesearchaeota archaeon]
MHLRFELRHILAILLGVAVLVVDFIQFKSTLWFIPLIIVSASIAWSQFWVDFFAFRKEQKEIEAQFPEFVRNLVGSVKSGMPISKAIIYVSKMDYGSLTPYVVKLANQVEWAIPVHKALNNFSRETKNNIIRRAISTVIEAETSGGNIEDVLTQVTDSVIAIKKIKEKRKASIHGQIVQSYIIFVVFVAVLVVIQNLLIPYIVNMSSADVNDIEGMGSSEIEGGGAMGGSELSAVTEKVDIKFSDVGTFFGTMARWFVSIRGVFLMLSLIQGLFAGMVLGKLSEGEVKAGLKHSLIMMTTAFFVISLAQGALTY